MVIFYLFLRRQALRNNERLFVGREEIGLDRVSHAARFVDGRKIGHSRQATPSGNGRTDGN